MQGSLIAPLSHGETRTRRASLPLVRTKYRSGARGNENLAFVFPFFERRRTAAIIRCRPVNSRPERPNRKAVFGEMHWQCRRSARSGPEMTYKCSAVVRQVQMIRIEFSFRYISIKVKIKFTPCSKIIRKKQHIEWYNIWRAEASAKHCCYL